MTFLAEMALGALLIAGTIFLVCTHHSGRLWDWLIERDPKSRVTDEIEHDRERRTPDHLLR
jgi:hypothetical protein